MNLLKIYIQNIFLSNNILHFLHLIIIYKNKHHHDIKLCGELGGMNLKNNVIELIDNLGVRFLKNEMGLILS